MADVNKLYEDIVKIATAMGLPVLDIRKRTEYERVDWRIGEATLHVGDEIILSYISSRTLEYNTVKALSNLLNTGLKLRREQEHYVYINLGVTSLLNGLATRKENSPFLNYVWNAILSGENFDPNAVNMNTKVATDVIEKDGYIFVMQENYISFVNKSGEGNGSGCLLDGYSQINYRSDYVYNLISKYNSFIKKYAIARVTKLVEKETDEAKKISALATLQSVSDFEGRSVTVRGHKISVDGSILFVGGYARITADGKLTITGTPKDNGSFLELIGIIKDSVLDIDVKSIGYLLNAVKDSPELVGWAKNLASIKALNLGGTPTASKEKSMAQANTGATGDATRKVIDRIVDRSIVIGKQAGLAAIADLLVKLVIDAIIEISVVRLTGKAKTAKRKALTEIYRDDFQKNIVRCAIVAGLEVLPETVTSKIPFDTKAVSNVMMVDTSRFVMSQVGQIAAGFGGEILEKMQQAIASIGKADVAGALTESAASTDNIIREIVETKEPVTA